MQMNVLPQMPGCMWQAPLHLLAQQVHATTISAIEKRSSVAHLHIHTCNLLSALRLVAKLSACCGWAQLMGMVATSLRLPQLDTLASEGCMDFFPYFLRLCCASLAIIAAVYTLKRSIHMWIYIYTYIQTDSAVMCVIFNEFAQLAFLIGITVALW